VLGYPLFPMVDEAHAEHTEFPRTGSRARRWNRFERDLYAWMNRPEGQFVCWLAARKLEQEQRPGPELRR